MDKEARLKFHEMQANWWMHSATNGHAATRKMYHGISSDDRPFTPEELRDDAMKISKRHMDLYLELAELGKE